MRKPVLCLLVIAIAANFPLAACGTPAPPPPAVPTIVPGPASLEVSASEPITLVLEDNFAIDIPDGGVYGDDTLTVEALEHRPHQPDSASEDIEVLGKVYDVDLASTELFRKPVRITIPYDPSLLPEGRTEAEIFAVYYYEGYLPEGRWIRLYGEIDQTNNTITVLTLHNGLWSWACSLVDNLKREVGFWFSGLASEPANLAQARRLVETRKQQWLESWDMLLAEVDHIEDLQEPLRLGFEIAAGVAGVLPYEKGAELLGLSAGKVALVSTAGHVIAVISAVAGTVYLAEWSTSWLEGKYLQQREKVAYERYQEAQCILYAFEDPGATSVPPDCPGYLESYYAALDEAQLASPVFDPEFSAISDEEVPTPIPPTDTPTHTAIPTDTRTHTPTATHTPTPTVTPVTQPPPQPPTAGTGTVTGSYSYVLIYGQPDQGVFAPILYAAPDGLPAPEHVCGLATGDALDLIDDRSTWIDDTVVQDDGTFRFENVPTGIPLFVSLGHHTHWCPGLACIVGAPLFTLRDGEGRDVGDMFKSCAFCCPCLYGHEYRCP